MPPPSRPASIARAGTPSHRRAAAAWIVRAGFLGAIVVEVLAILLADPAELRWAAAAKGWPLPALHVAAFLVFWALASAACLLGYLCWLAVGAWKVRTRLR
ncbi:MAG TPA: hypothetical protein VGF26_24110 [Ramlibacter sp.]